MTPVLSLYAERDSGLHRLHPLTKAAIALFCLAAGLAAPGDWGAFAVFAALVMPVATWGRILRPLLIAAWRTTWPFALSLFLIQGFLWPGGTPLATIGPAALNVEGLRFAVQATGRILALVASFLLLSLSTRPDALMLALTGVGVPHSVAYIVLTTLQIVPRFRARAAAILDAQRARGLETGGGPLQRARGLLPLVVPLVLGSIVEVEERAIALEARAFGRSGPRTSLLLLADSRPQAVARWGLLLAACAAVAARVLMGAGA